MKETIYLTETTGTRTLFLMTCLVNINTNATPIIATFLDKLDNSVLFISFSEFFDVSYFQF